MSDAPHLRVSRLPWRKIVAAAAVIIGIGSLFGPGTAAAATVGLSAVPTPETAVTPRVFGDGVEGELSADLTIADSGAAAPGNAIEGTVVLNNRSGAPAGEGELVIRVARGTIDTRYDHANWADPNAAPSGWDAGEEVYRLPIAAIESDSRLEVPITIPASATEWLESAEPGARGITVEWLIDDESRAKGNTTFVWNGASLAQPVSVSPIVPVLAPIRETSLLTIRELEELTSPSGSLTQLLEAVADTNATLAIDPRILVSIRALGTDAPATAVEWLAELESLTNPSFPLEFADASTTLQLAAGLEEPLDPLGFEYATEEHAFVQDAEVAETDAETTAETNAETNGTPPPDTSAPPTDGEKDGESAPSDSSASPQSSGPQTDTPETATPSATQSVPEPETVEAPEPDLEALTAFNYTRTDLVWPASGTVSDLAALSPNEEVVIVDGDQVTLSPDRNATPSSQHRAEHTELLITDTELDDSVSQAVTADSDLEFQDAAAGVAALLAVIARELPNEQREIVVTLPRAVLDDPERLGDLLDLLADTNWTQVEPTPEPVADLASLTETGLVPGFHSAAAIARAEELFAAEDRGFALTSLYNDRDAAMHELRARLLTTLANAVIVTDRWGVATGEFLRDATAPDTQIRIVAGSEIQLIGHDSSLPLFIENATDREVTLEVRLRPTTGHLKAVDATIITIPANSIGRATLPVQAIANGVSGVDATLWTVDDVQLRNTADLKINVHASLETYAIVLLIAGGLLLFGFGIWRTVRRRKRERTEEVQESGGAQTGTERDTGTTSPRAPAGETSDSESVND